jgi:organic radical activating enzyme
VNFHLLLNRCRCDYRCIFCTMGSEAHRAEQEQILEDFDEKAEARRIDQVLVDASQRPGVDALHIMGNDPCNQPGLPDIVARARALGFRRVVLETNGLRLAEESFVQALVEAGVDSLKIPVYGSSAAVHDAIVRLPGAFARLEQAFDHLRSVPVDVRLHALILKQNASDLRACRFPFPLSFRFPFAHDRADLDYPEYAPRLRDVPPAVLAKSDLVIPCINGQRAQALPQEERARPEAPTDRDRDTNVTRARPSCCSEAICPAYHQCQGIYLCYYRLYGEEEFHFDSRLKATAAIWAARTLPTVAAGSSRSGMRLPRPLGRVARRALAGIRGWSRR